VVALVDDLMDRSRVSVAIPDVQFASDAASCAGATVVVVDIVRHGDAIGAVRTTAPAARVVAFGPHVDDERLAAARAAGADAVLARSRFFHDPAAAVAGS
jgi:hypothetical protein